MKKFNLSQIMKRAWELVKTIGVTISDGLKVAWKEAKNVKADITETLKKNLEDLSWNCIYINAGMVRRVREKMWEKGEAKRNYLSIDCYTLAGRHKRTYKCGYVDMVTGEYVVTRWDDVDALKKEYIGN